MVLHPKPVGFVPGNDTALVYALPPRLCPTTIVLELTAGKLIETNRTTVYTLQLHPKPLTGKPLLSKWAWRGIEVRSGNQKNFQKSRYLCYLRHGFILK